MKRIIKDKNSLASQRRTPTIVACGNGCAVLMQPGKPGLGSVVVALKQGDGNWLA